MAPITVLVNHGVKLEKFNELNFKKWQLKILFYLTTLGLVRFLIEDPPTKKDDEQDSEFLIAIDTWKHANYIFWSYVMNYLNNFLYDVYSGKRSSKELWESLD